jgi:RimJ/RimL family protein N-acetyltransferase
MHPTSPPSQPLEPARSRRAAPELETERLRLRQFRDGDFATYQAWCANPDLMRYLGGRTFSTLEAWRHMAYVLGHWQLRGYGYYAVEEKATGRLVGRVGFTDSEGWPGFELGWTLAPEARGQGYAREAARFLLDYAFERLERPHVMSLIHPDNAPSIRVAEYLGQRVEGQTEVLTMPVLIYAIDHAGWRATRNRQQGE